MHWLNLFEGIVLIIIGILHATSLRDNAKSSKTKYIILAVLCIIIGIAFIVRGLKS